MSYFPDRDTAERWGAAYALSLSSLDADEVRSALATMADVESLLRTDEDGNLVPRSPSLPSTPVWHDVRGRDQGPTYERPTPSGATIGVPTPSHPSYHLSVARRTSEGRSTFKVVHRGTAYVEGPAPRDVEVGPVLDVEDDDEPVEVVRLSDLAATRTGDEWMRDNYPDVPFENVVGTVHGVSWSDVGSIENADEDASPEDAYLLAQHRTDLGGGFVNLDFPIGSHERADHRTYDQHPRTNPRRGWAMRDAIDPTSTYAAARPLKAWKRRTYWTAPAARQTDPSYVRSDKGRNAHRRTRIAVLRGGGRNADGTPTYGTGKRWTSGGTPVTRTGALVTYADKLVAHRDVPRVEVRDERGRLIEVRPGRTAIRDERGNVLDGGRGGAVRTIPTESGWVGTRAFRRILVRTSDQGTRRAAERARAEDAKRAKRDAIATDLGAAVLDAFHQGVEGTKVEVEVEGVAVRFTRTSGRNARYKWTAADGRTNSFVARTPAAAAMRIVREVANV